jgi:hypothetical protein
LRSFSIVFHASSAMGTALVFSLATTCLRSRRTKIRLCMRIFFSSSARIASASLLNIEYSPRSFSRSTVM